MRQLFFNGLVVFTNTWPMVFASILVTGYACIPLFVRQKLSVRSTLLFGLFLGIALILRLAFLTELTVPPYFDSVEHYRIIKELIIALENRTLLHAIPTLTPGYYHIGFHLLVSFMAISLRTAPTDVILVLGQILLTWLPIPVFFIIKNETDSTAAAFFAAMLAGFGWIMPAYAINWGKYPAVAGIFTFSMTLSLAHLASKQGQPRKAVIWFIFGTLLSALFHTRVLIIAGIFLLSWYFANETQNLPKKIQFLLLTNLIMLTFLFGLFTWQEPLLKLALTPYLENGLWITLGVLALSPFALIKFPKGFSFTILFIFGLLTCMFIPANGPGLVNQTFLDRPFVEMLLYFPLSLLGGLGLAGLADMLGGIKSVPERTHFFLIKLVPLFMIGVLGFVSLISYDFYPSDCCNFIKQDDAIAIEWLRTNSQENARILIPATNMYVQPSGPAGQVGTDAGVWIPHLADRHVTLKPFEFNFHSLQSLEQLCQAQIDYIYIGSTDQSFDPAPLQQRTDWYHNVLSLPESQLFQLTSCLPTE